MPDENKSHFVDVGTKQKPWWPRFQSLLKLLLWTRGVGLSKSTQCLGAVVPLAKFFSSVLQFLPIHSRTKYVSMHFTPWLYLHSPSLPMMHLQCVHPHFQPVASGCCRHQRPRWDERPIYTLIKYELKLDIAFAPLIWNKAAVDHGPKHVVKKKMNCQIEIFGFCPYK